MAGLAGSRPQRASIEQVRVNTASSNLDDYISRFNRTVSLTALLAGTAINLLTDSTSVASGGLSDVGTGYTVVLEGWRIKVKGTTAWSGGSGTYIQIEDTSGQTFVRALSAALTSQALLMDNSANVTLDALYTNTGGRLTTSKGLRIKGDANYGAGSDVQVTVWGYIEKLS